MVILMQGFETSILMATVVTIPFHCGAGEEAHKYTKMSSGGE